MASKIRQSSGRVRLRLAKLRPILAILLLGFVIAGAVELYNYINHSYPLPFASSVFVIGPFVTLAGLLILWVGRSEWDSRLSRWFQLAERVFALNIAAIMLAVVIVFWYATMSTTAIPSLAETGFGAAIVAAVVLNFVIYVLIAFDLTGVFGKALLLISLSWASVVAIWLGQDLSREFGAIVLVFQDRTFDFGPVSASISDVESYFAVAYFLLTIAYLDAYHRSYARARKSS
jgi:hypothetical protein